MCNDSYNVKSIGNVSYSAYMKEKLEQEWQRKGVRNALYFTRWHDTSVRKSYLSAETGLWYSRGKKSWRERLVGIRKRGKAPILKYIEGLTRNKKSDTT